MVSSVPWLFMSSESELLPEDGMRHRVIEGASCLRSVVCVCVYLDNL